MLEDADYPTLAAGALDLSEAEAPRDGYAMMPLQTALPLRGLAACGFSGDPRAERAYDWLLAQRLPDGAWPTGLARSGVYGYVAGYRRMPHSRWGCRSNTTGALLCLALHPQRRSGPQDERVASLVSFVKGLQGPLGLWEYQRRPQIARWLTFDLLRSLAVLDSEVTDWLSLEPRTPFQAYQPKSKRY